jgi:hypothetical protein
MGLSVDLDLGMVWGPFRGKGKGKARATAINHRDTEDTEKGWREETGKGFSTEHTEHKEDTEQEITPRYGEGRQAEGAGTACRAPTVEVCEVRVVVKGEPHPPAPSPVPGEGVTGGGGL